MAKGEKKEIGGKERRGGRGRRQKGGEGRGDTRSIKEQMIFLKPDLDNDSSEMKLSVRNLSMKYS